MERKFYIASTCNIFKITPAVKITIGLKAIGQITARVNAIDVTFNFKIVNCNLEICQIRKKNVNQWDNRKY